MNAFYCNVAAIIAHILNFSLFVTGAVKKALAMLRVKERAKTAKCVVKIIAHDGWETLCGYVSEGGIIRRLLVSGAVSGAFFFAAYAAAQAARQLLRILRPHLLVGVLVGCAVWNLAQLLRKKATKESFYASLLVAVTLVLGRAILDTALGVLLITMARQIPAAFAVGMAAFNLAVFFCRKRAV